MASITPRCERRTECSFARLPDHAFRRPVATPAAKRSYVSCNRAFSATVVGVKAVHVGCSGWNYADWRGLVYPEGLPQRLLARALRDPLRHGRGQRDLLPAAHPRDRRALGRGDARRVPVRDQGEPLPHPHQAPAQHAEVSAAAAGAARAAARHAEDGADAVAAPGELPARRRAPGRRRCRRSGRAATRSSSGTELVLRAGVRAAARARRRARVRRPPERPFQSLDPTADWIYVRLHRGARGRRGNYSPAELEIWRRRIAAWRAEREVYLYANNDWEGFSAKNATWLKDHLSGN